jgi:hypothetical protein
LLPLAFSPELAPIFLALTQEEKSGSDRHKGPKRADPRRNCVSHPTTICWTSDNSVLAGATAFLAVLGSLGD